MSKNWLFLQLVDSAFPTGGFAHSGGLEAALQLGEIRGVSGLEHFLKDILWQTGYGVLPLANETFENPDSIDRIDSLCDVFLSGSVNNRASRVQGRTFLSTCLRSLSNEKLEHLNQQIQAKGLHQHFAPIFGATMNALELPLKDMQQILLHGVLRGTLSAAVRLGVIGPYQAQRIQFSFSEILDTVLKECGNMRTKDLAQTAPLIEMFQSMHDRLYSKLFLS